jgi:hypothetical protein
LRVLVAACFLTALLASSPALAQPDAAKASFRRANESAARSQWNDAIEEYSRLAKGGVRAPTLYWNWAQAASAGGKKGEALWAQLSARDMTPFDSGMHREIERLRGELGLDPSEVSLGFLGDSRLLARRFRFDGIAIVAFLASILLTLGKKPRRSLSLGVFLVGLLLLTPFFAGAFREPRGVIVQKDAPLMDAPKDDAIALANLREGEVVPLLGEEGEYVRIQDASGARGFAHKGDVRRIGTD